MIAAKFFDMVVGVDIHMVMVPTPAPVPTPLPHPFVGLVFDPAGVIVGAAISAAMSGILGTPFTGPVMVNMMPAANTGTEATNKMVMPHFPMPPGTAWAPIPAAPKPVIPGKPPDPPTPTPMPSNDGVIVTGSKTVSFSGGNASRLGSLVMTCAEPIRLPSSTIIAIPLGAPVLIGGPPSLDLLQALLGMIKTKWVTGRLRLLTGAFEGSWRSRLICLLTGHPVDVITGMVLTDAVDFELPGPIPFTFERTYYSKSQHRGSLGCGWSHRYDQEVRFEKKRIVYRTDDGRELYFKKVEPGRTTRNQSENLVLKRENNRILITGKDRLTHIFGAGGRGNDRWPLLGIADSRRNALRFDYDQRGQLVAAVDSTGRKIEFINDEHGRISAINLPHPTQPGAKFTVARFEYDTHGDLVAAFNAEDRPYRYAYKYHLLVQETDRNGLSFYFAYDGIDPDARCVRTWGDGGIFDHILTYDAEKHITVKEDSSGNRTTYYGNEAGLVDKIVDSLGRERAFEYDESLRTVCETDPAGAKLTIEYDERGNITNITDADGVSRGYEYDEHDQPVHEVFGEGVEFTSRYTPHGELSESLNPLGGAVRFDYSDRGDLLRVRTRGTTDFKFTWDNARNLTKMEQADGQPIEAKYDSLGTVIGVEFSDGKSISYQHNLLGLPVGVTRSWIGVDRLEYDPQGNLVKHIDPGGGVTSYETGHFNKVTAITYPGRGIRRFEYNKEGDLTAVINEKGERFEYERNSEGEITKEIDFSGRTTERLLDEAGRVTEIIEHDGRRRQMEWTPAGRLKAITYEDGCFDKFTYGGQGQLIEAENESGKLVRSFDAVGRITGEKWEDFTIEHEYDLDDRRVLTRSSDGSTLRFAYDAAGNLVRLQADGVHEFSREFDDLGLLRVTRMPGGHVQKLAYDENNSLREQMVYHQDNQLVSGRLFEFNSGEVLAGIADGQRGLTSYAFGPMGIERVFRDGKSSASYTYDDAGERLPADGPGEIGPGGRLLRFNNILYEYDDLGRVVKRTNEGRSWEYTYNDRGQVTKVRLPDGTEVKYTYDPFWRRISKQNGHHQTQWRWNGSVPFREESINGAAPESRKFLFEPEGFAPLGVLTDGKCLSYLTDHLGTPQEVITEDGNVAWAGDYDPWGRVGRTLHGGFENPLRFPGQYHDEETGLHYNRFRYYDPDTGRYLTPDPVGLIGGLNLYGYSNDPLAVTDPLGLSCVGRFVRSYAIFLRSGIRPRHARAIMRHAMETGETYAFRNISSPGRRFGSMIAGLFGMRPKPSRLNNVRSNALGIATDANGARFRSDYDPAFYRNADGSVMSNSEAAAANTRLNNALGGDELQHPTHVTMADPSSGLTPSDVNRIGPPSDSTVFHPDGSTSQTTTSQMRDSPGMPWPW